MGLGWFGILADDTKVWQWFIKLLQNYFIQKNVGGRVVMIGTEIEFKRLKRKLRITSSRLKPLYGVNRWRTYYVPIDWSKWLLQDCKWKKKNIWARFSKHKSVMKFYIFEAWRMKKPSFSCWNSMNDFNKNLFRKSNN